MTESEIESARRTHEKNCSDAEPQRLTKFRKAIKHPVVWLSLAYIFGIVACKEVLRVAGCSV